MTQKEKAIAYDKAIERARKIHNENKAQPFDVMLKVFPELRELEDERIRKALIELSKEVAQEQFFTNRGTNLQNVLDWIEKQGEQNPAWSEEDEAVLDALIRRLEGEDIHVSPHLAVKCLKSLRHKNTWKPSDKQMKALYDSIPEDVKEISEREMLLNELYKDLRKEYYGR